MGNSGPFRGELAEATEGAIRTAAHYSLAWPDQAKTTTPYATFSLTGLPAQPSPALSGGSDTERPARSTEVDQTDAVGPERDGASRSRAHGRLVAVRWKQWRATSPTSSDRDRTAAAGISASASRPLSEGHNIEITARRLSLRKCSAGVRMAQVGRLRPGVEFKQYPIRCTQHTIQGGLTNRPADGRTVSASSASTVNNRHCARQNGSGNHRKAREVNPRVASDPQN